jgi:vitamin B12 transporter
MKTHFRPAARQHALSWFQQLGVRGRAPFRASYFMSSFSSFRRTALATALSSISFFANAQTEAVSTLDAVVVTPSRIAQLERDVLGDVTVIGRDELDRAGQESLADVLARQSGFSMYNSGGPHTQTSVFLRGAGPSQTLVLVDGMRVNSMTSGAINWNTIDPAMVERVEIVRGAASSLYGSNAIGGVINIITRKNQGDQPTQGWMNFGLGSYGTVKSNAGISGSNDGFDYAFSAGMADSSGYSVTSPDVAYSEYNPDKDGYTQHNFSGSLGYQWQAGQRLDLTAYNGYVNGDFDSGQSDPIAYSQTRQQVYGLSSTNQLSQAWQSVLRLGFSKESAISHSYGSDFVFGHISRNYAWQNNLKLDDNQSVSLLLERLEERVAPGTTSYTLTERNTNAAGAIYRGNFNMHHVQASLRNDNISGYGNKATGGLSYEIDITPHWRAGIAASTGFRAPTFSDLYYPKSGNYVGNPNLKPEHSRNVEASLSYSRKDTTLGLVVFQNKIKDMINGSVKDPATGISMPQNINRATLRGISFTAEQQFGNTTLNAGVDLLDPRNDASPATAQGNQLPYRARQTYRLGALHQLDALTLGAEYQFTGKRYNDTDNTEIMGGYGLTNLTAAYTFNRNVSVQLRWDNVFDKEYVSMKGYRTPGSNLFINLSLRM